MYMRLKPRAFDEHLPKKNDENSDQVFGAPADFVCLVILRKCQLLNSWQAFTLKQLLGIIDFLHKDPDYELPNALTGHKREETLREALQYLVDEGLVTPDTVGNELKTHKDDRPDPEDPRYVVTNMFIVALIEANRLRESAAP